VIVGTAIPSAKTVLSDLHSGWTPAVATISADALAYADMKAATSATVPPAASAPSFSACKLVDFSALLLAALILPMMPAEVPGGA
jgi:hypothetical protein